MSHSSSLTIRLRMVLLSAMIALGPLQWIEVIDLGLSLRLSHFPFFLLALMGAVDIATTGLQRRAVQLIAPFVLSYAVYFLMLSISAAVADTDLLRIAKYGIYSMSSLFIFFALTRLNITQFTKSAFFGAISAVAMFSVFAYFSLQAKDLNLFSIISNAVTTGNANILQFQLFVNLFNDGVDGSLSLTKASFRNSLVGSVIVAYCILMYTLSAGKWRILSVTGALLCLVIVLISVSRSNIIVLFLISIPPAFYFIRARTGLGVFSVFFATLVGIWTAMFADLGGIIEIFASRFTNFDQDGRILIFQQALQQIDSNPFFGSGFGTEVDIGEKGSVSIHNLFLNAWISTGIFGLIPAILFILILLRFYIRKSIELKSNIADMFMIGMLLLPIFRSQISGDGGNFTVAEWVCIILAASFYHIRSKNEQHATTVSNHPTRRSFIPMRPVQTGR